MQPLGKVYAAGFSVVPGVKVPVTFQAQLKPDFGFSSMQSPVAGGGVGALELLLAGFELELGVEACELELGCEARELELGGSPPSSLELLLCVAC